MKGTALCFLSRDSHRPRRAAFREEAGNKENRPACRGELANDLTAQKWLRAYCGEFPGIETSSTRKCKPRQPASSPFSTTPTSHSSFSVTPGFLRRFLAIRFIRITWSSTWETLGVFARAHSIFQRDLIILRGRSIDIYHCVRFNSEEISFPRRQMVPSEFE